jgi:uncharacterized protein (TIGR03084 family)
MTIANAISTAAAAPDTLTTALDHFRQEVHALAETLADLPSADWERQTSFKNWTIEDVVLHLYACDRLAYFATMGEDAFRLMRASIVDRRSAGLSYIEEHRERFPTPRGKPLLDAWMAGAYKLCDRLAQLPLDIRLPWAGPPMGVRMFAVARQMETWAHGQAIYDVLGIDRIETDRLYDIAHLGVKTLRWSFINRGLPPPENPPWVSLRAPSGKTWEWGSTKADNFVRGTAVDFCRVVAQTRHVLDTTLVYQGDAARQWMSIAQCFAGPPGDPPTPGSRRMNERRV